MGLLNKDVRYLHCQLIDGEIEAFSSRGNPLRVKLNNRVNPILSPECGSKICYHTSETAIHKEFHLRIDLSDRAALTVRSTGMGGIHVMGKSEQKPSYVFKRDFNRRYSRPYVKNSPSRRIRYCGYPPRMYRE